MTVREASPGDCEALTRLVRGSSEYSGAYRAIVRDLAISPGYVAANHVVVAEIDGRVVGFYALVCGAEGPELDLMFVSDDARGSGVGAALFGHMRERARSLGYGSVLIVAHPPAEGFYARMGAVRVGTRPPSGRVTWSRPRMELRIT